MSEIGRVALFLTVVLSIWSLMHVYVGYHLWRLPGLDGARTHLVMLLLGALLWLSYPLGRILDRQDFTTPAYFFEVLGATWMGVLFFAISGLLVVDILTGFGFWLRDWVMPMRLGAAIVAAVLSAIAIVQAARGPVVRTAEIPLPGLPAEGDGLRLVQLSDLHLGTLLKDRWLEARVEQVLELRPDIVVITGDLVDSDSRHVEDMVPTLQRLRAPLGVFAISGNHEFYAGLERSLALMERAGYRMLRDRWEEVRPGLVLAGIDDLTARRQFGVVGDPLATALAGRPAGATIFLSHTPWRAEEVAARGVNLMLSGHTHAGQIWPFGALVRIQYKLLGGFYQVGKMRVLVSRGTGTWGPLMRLWRRSEIWLLTLRSAPTESAGSR